MSTKNKYTSVALLDNYAQQVQGIGGSKQAAYNEAKSYGIADLPATVAEVDEQDRTSGDPRFQFRRITPAQVRKLNEDPTALYAELYVNAPTAVDAEADERA